MTVTSDGSHEKTSSTDIDTKTKPQHRSSPKKILQRLPIAFEYVKAENTSKNLLNEIHQVIVLCIKQKETLKKV